MVRKRQPIVFVKRCMHPNDKVSSSSSSLLLLWNSPASSDPTTTSRNKTKPRVFPATTTVVRAAASASSRPKSKQNWNFRLAQMQAFQAQHGHCWVTASDEAKYPGLYQWTRSVRRHRHAAAAAVAAAAAAASKDVPDATSGPNKLDHSSNTSSSSSRSTNPTIMYSGDGPRRPLPRQKLQALLDLDFCWDVQDAAWQIRYHQLRQFHAVHQHCRVPNNAWDFPAGLGVWVRNQRREYRKLVETSSHSDGRSTKTSNSTLTPDRLKALEQLNFEWYRPHAVAWQNSYEQLRIFHEQHGHANVPQSQHGRCSASASTTEDDNSQFTALGQWCMNQRTEYKKFRRGVPTALTEDRIRLLERLHFQWNVREHQWQCMLDRLRDYYRLQGHVHIAVADTANTDLRRWLIWQRYEYQKRKKMKALSSPLTVERIAAIETAIPNFVWKARNGSGPSSEDWAKLFNAMRDKGLAPGVRPKQHWFEGTNPFAVQIKDTWTEQDLLELWNQENEDGDDDDDNHAANSNAWYK